MKTQFDQRNIPPRPIEADTPPSITVTRILKTHIHSEGKTHVLLDAGIQPENLRIPGLPYPTTIPEAVFRDSVIDPAAPTKQTFNSNSLYFLLSGQLELIYTEDGEVRRITSSFYDSSEWVAYSKMWDENRECLIKASPIFKLLRIKKLLNSNVHTEYNDFNNLNVLVRKLENSEVTINAPNNSCLFIVNHKNNFVVESDAEVFDVSLRPASSNINFQPTGLDSYYYDTEDVFKFLVSGETKVTAANAVHLILLSPKL